MRYAGIEKFETVNGKHAGVSLYVQGCHFKCKGCFNPETHDFNGGLVWTDEVEQSFLDAVSKEYIKRVSILGGEPLASENLYEVRKIISRIKRDYPNKTIYLFSGYKWEQIMLPIVTDDLDSKRDEEIHLRIEIVRLCDYMVDGTYEDDKKDLTIAFRGSLNQRIINIQKSIKENEIILLEE